VIDDATVGLKDFFRLSRYQFEHLFVAGRQRRQYGGQILTIYATPQELANNIFKFLDKNR
jgi:hypothetical protein